MKQTIDIKGITTSAAYEDGDCLAVLNMRRKNGAMQAVAPRRTVRSFAHDYVLLFVHKNAGYEHWIGIDKDNILCFIHSDNEKEELLRCKGKVSITQMGNLLNILDDTGLKYLLWKDGQYNLINLKLAGEQEPKESDLEKRIDVRVEGIRSATGVREIREYRQHNLPQNLSNTQRIDYARPLMQKALDIEARDGRLTGFFMACTAYELYDGSYVLCSRPVLLGQAFDEGTRYTAQTNINGSASDYLQNSLGFNGTRNTIPVLNEDGFSVKHMNTITAFRANQLANVANNTAHFPFLFSSMFFDGNTHDLFTNISANRLRLRLSTALPEQYSDIVKGLSVFITPQVQQYDLTDINLIEGRVDGNATHRIHSFVGKPKTNPELIKELENQLFYKVQSFSFEELNNLAGEWLDVDLKGKLGDNLYTQELLPIDHSRESIIPQRQYVYNSRLHVMNYKKIAVRSLPFEHFFPNGRINEDGFSSGQFASDLVARAGVAWWMAADIKLGLQTARTVRFRKPSGTSVLTSDELMPMISFPDTRASRLEIQSTYINTNGANVTRRWLLDFKKHPHYNFAYYLHPDLKPFGNTSHAGVLPAVPPESNTVEYVGNGIKVSATNNPMVFPVSNTYLVSTGEVLNATANVLNVSDRNFGQYPLYIATTQGFFMLAVGSEQIAYSHIVPSSSRIVPLSPVLCSTPYGIAFLSTRGLYLINGNEVVCLSLAIEEKSGLIEGTCIRGREDFLKFIQQADNLLYNSHEGELIIINKQYAFNYVYSFEQRMFYHSTEQIDTEVRNIEPKLLVLEKRSLKDYSLPAALLSDISFTTRPLRFGIEEIKKIQRVILRAAIWDMWTYEHFLCLYGSNDGVNFKLVRAMSAPKAQGMNHRDFDLGLMAACAYRYFILKFEAQVDDRTKIGGIDFIVRQNYRKDKMR